MHVNQPKKDKNVVKGTARKVGTGHVPHRGGGGAHKHKGDRRQGNRSQQNERAVSEY
jgi:hypothetical protein